jgi:iron(III) transport system ATP-binding protein
MLSIRNLRKSYAPRQPGAPVVHAIDGISFEVAQGEFFTLLGPSGCGKSTTLQSIAGLETPTSGTIEMDGKAVYCSERQVLVPANRRNLGMVFQSYAIWPHMTVFDNVAFPLVHGPRKTDSAEVRKRVMRSLDLVKLADFADRPSPHLSGGQQQRVALARALVHEPAVLLLDEPLSNLDAKLRDIMRIEIRQMVKSLGITTIFVTHDQLEAMSMSDTVLLMRSGRIVQRGTPREVFLQPTSAFTADFMGRSNLVPARVCEGGVETSFGMVPCPTPTSLAKGASALLVVRPHAIELRESGDPSPLTGAVFEGRVRQSHFLGDVIEAEIALGDCLLRAAVEPYLHLAPDDRVRIGLRADRCVVVPPDDVSKASAYAPAVTAAAAS